MQRAIVPSLADFNLDDGIAFQTAYYCKEVKDLSLVNYISIDVIGNAEEIDTHTLDEGSGKSRL